MSRRRFSILRVGDGWRILGKGQVGGFESCELAALATARLVAEAIHDGYQVELLMEKRTGAGQPASAPADLDVASAHASYRRTTGPFAVAVDEAAQRPQERLSFRPTTA
jgi:hypothetical protein